MKQRIRQFTALGLALLLLAAMLPPAAASYDRYSGTMAGDGIGIVAHGVDLSSWQGENVDFARIAAQGYDFVILRAGFSCTEDAVFERNYAAAKAAQLDVGAYLYSYAATTEEVLREAESCKAWLAGKQLEYPVYFDLEDPGVHGAMSRAALTELALTFLDSLAADGWLVGLYSCRSWLEEKMDTALICARYECWMAQYPAGGTYDNYEKYHAVYGMWQYSASGEVDGIPGKADRNVAFKDYPSICREYGFNGYSAQGQTLTLQGASVPRVLYRGEAFDVTGTVRSADGDLLRVTLGIYDEAGTMLAGATAEPHAASFDLTLIRQSVDMTRLPDGEYTYRIMAETASTERLLHASSFAISANGLWLHELTLPEDLKEGTGFPVSGTVTTAEPMSRLTLAVMDTSGNAVLSAELTPNGTDAELADMRLNLASLEKGEYFYQATAQTPRGTQTAQTEHFFVWERRDPITLRDFRLNERYAPGTLTGLSGTAASQNSEMQLEVALLDADGAQVQRVSTVSPAKTVSLARFNDALRLKELPLGYYVCQIIATNDAGPTVLYRSGFSIVRDEISLCGTVLPVTLGRGDSFLLRGAIASDQSPLRHVSAVLYDARGVPVRNCAAQPNYTVFSLEDFNAGLHFSDLAAGEYRLCISAENAELRKILFDDTVLVLSGAAKISWDGAPPALCGQSFSEGQLPGCTGTLTADQPITTLRAAVLDEEGESITAAAVETEAQTLSVGLLNEQLRLAALPDGEYRLQIWASCGGAEELMLSDRFSVTACRHKFLRDGTQYAADCTHIGATCPTRCSSCGGAVAQGMVSDKRAHRMNNGSCTACGLAQWKSFPVVPLEEMLSPDERYVLAVAADDGWYALDADARTVQFDQTKMTATAELFWSVEPQENGTFVFRNYRGEALHIDANGLRAATGEGHTALSVSGTAELSRDEFCVAFTENTFCVDTEAVHLTILLLNWH